MNAPKPNPTVEQQRKRVERAVSDMIDDLYKSNLRKMQSEMHLCAAACCDDNDKKTLDTVQHCIEGCANPLIRAQDYLQHELGQFQGRLQKCVMECNEEVRHKMPPSPKNSELAKYQFQFERCTIQCVDRHIGLIPAMMKTIKSVLAKGPDMRHV